MKTCLPICLQPQAMGRLRVGEQSSGMEIHEISAMEASAIITDLFENDYIDEKGNILPSYHEDLKNGQLAPMGKKLQPISEQVHKLVQGIFDPSALDGMIEDGNGSATVAGDHLNENAQKVQFKRLWEEINHRYVYTVHYDSEELISKAIGYINENLRVTQLKYVVTTGEQGENETDFTGRQTTRTQQMRDVSARLPRTFQIPTPVGGYAPDWAIAFYDNMGVKHVFFIAETKGSMESMQLKGIEQNKIKCLKKLFNNVSTSKVRYHEVTDYQTMLDVMNSLP